MTDREFQSWFGFVCAVFDWAEKKFDRKGGEELANVVGAWKRAMLKCDYHDAREVVEAMVAGEIPQPEAYDRDKFIPRVREECERRRKNRESIARLEALDDTGGREPRYHCPHCRDTGYTDEWQDDVLHSLMAGVEPERWTAWTSFCDCSTGRRRYELDQALVREQKKKHGMRQFDKDKNLRTPVGWFGDEDAKEQARQWAKNRREFLSENSPAGMFARFNANGVQE